MYCSARLLRREVLGGEPHHLRLEADYYILADEYDAPAPVRERAADFQNSVVALGLGQPLRQLYSGAVRLDAQRASARQGCAFEKVARDAQLFEKTDALARVRAALSVVALEPVELLEADYREDDVVVLERQQSERRLYHYVGVQHIYLFHAHPPRAAARRRLFKIIVIRQGNAKRAKMVTLR